MFTPFREGNAHRQTVRFSGSISQRMADSHWTKTNLDVTRNYWIIVYSNTHQVSVTRTNYKLIRPTITAGLCMLFKRQSSAFILQPEGVIMQPCFICWLPGWAANGRSGMFPFWAMENMENDHPPIFFASPDPRIRRSSSWNAKNCCWQLSF